MSSAPNSPPSGTGTRAWKSLGMRLALWYVAVTFASFVALAIVVPLTMHVLEERDGQRTTEGALARYKGALEVGGTNALRAMFSCDPGEDRSVAIRLRDERHVEVYRASTDGASDRVAATLGDEGTNRVIASHPPMGWHVASASVSQGRTLDIVFHDDGAPIVWSHARRASLVILACGLLTAILGAFAITRRALRPVSDLARATEGIVTSGDLALRVPIRGTNDDLDDLGALFNRMLARNESLVRAMKESLDNVAHDLRTPLTRLRAGAELALRGAPDVAHSRAALAETIEESDRVLSMLTTLMDITEAEAGAMRLDKHEEDLSIIVREAVDLYDMVSNDRGVHLVTRLAPGVIVTVDRARIRQACANLIDNAIKYTAAGGRVEVTVTVDGVAGILAVADTGVGIPIEERSRVWERLYRGDRSRTERGLGLGLALVKAIVEAHDGTVSLHSEVGVGSTFEVRLRLSHRPAP